VLIFRGLLLFFPPPTPHPNPTLFRMDAPFFSFSAYVCTLYLLLFTAGVALGYEGALLIPTVRRHFLFQRGPPSLSCPPFSILQEFFPGVLFLLTGGLGMILLLKSRFSMYPPPNRCVFWFFFWCVFLFLMTDLFSHSFIQVFPGAIPQIPSLMGLFSVTVLSSTNCFLRSFSVGLYVWFLR